MDYTDLLGRIRTEIQNSAADVESVLEEIFGKYAANTDLMEFEIHSDEFELIAFIGRHEAWPENVQFEKRPFSAVAKLLDFLEEPKTAEGYAEQEQVFVETYQLMFQAMVGACARLTPKPRVEAYVRETDGLQAIELSTGKTVDVTVFESRLYYIRPEPERIEYRPLCVSEKARLPQLFTRPPAQMSDEEIGKDLDRYFEFIKAEFARVLPRLTEIFKGFIAALAPEFEQAGFIDINVEEHSSVHIFVSAVPEGFEEEVNFPNGIEVDLGSDNPLGGYLTFVTDIAMRLIYESERDRDVSFAIADMGVNSGLKLNIKRAWDEAAAGSGLPAAFFRSQFMNRWMDMDNFENNLSLVQVNAMAKGKK